MAIINNSYYLIEPDKQKLKDLGFRYSRECSEQEADCYIYRFPVSKYKKTTTLVCEFKVYLDNGEVRIDVYCANNGSSYAPYYNPSNPLYNSHQTYIKKVEQKIRNQMKKFNIKRRK